MLELSSTSLALRGITIFYRKVEEVVGVGKEECISAIEIG